MNCLEFDEFSKPYQCAEITSIYLKKKAQNDANQKYVHLYSLVELIPTNQYSSIELPIKSSDIKVNRNLKLIIQRKRCTLEQAKEYFYSEDEVVLPVYERKIPLPQLTHNPLNGYYTLSPQNGWDKSPATKVLPKRQMGFRVSIRMDTKKSVYSLLAADYSDSEKQVTNIIEKICARIDDELQIELSNHQEFLGSIIIAAQNPYLWAINRIENKNAPDWALLLMERKGMSCKGLEIFFSRADNMGMVFSFHVVVDGPIVTIPLPYKMNHLDMKMWDKNGKLLEDRSLPFFGNDGKEEAVWELEKEHETARSFRMLAKTNAFHYFFAGEQERARNVLKQVISGARNQLVICDPYLREEVSDFITGNQLGKVDVILFTSLHAFNKDAQTNQDNLNALLKTIDDLSNRSGINSTTLYILVGKAHNMGLLHDRFIIRDKKQAWSLGSSINAFASKDTMLIQLPEPSIANLIDRVDEWKSNEHYAVLGAEYSGFLDRLNTRENKDDE